VKRRRGRRRRKKKRGIVSERSEGRMRPCGTGNEVPLMEREEEPISKEELDSKMTLPSTPRTPEEI